jgi:hypothetical protein
MPILYPRRPCQWWLSKPWPQTLHKQLLTTSTGVVPGHHHHHHHRRMEIPCMTWSRRGWEGRSVGVGVEEGWHAGTRTPQLPDAKQLSMVRVGWGWDALKSSLSSHQQEEKIAWGKVKYPLACAFWAYVERALELITWYCDTLRRNFLEALMEMKSR